jgi:hypothetical protein
VGYESDYRAKAKELQGVYDKIDKLSERALVLSKQLAHLRDLIKLDNPAAIDKITDQSTYAQFWAHMAPTLANAIRRILAASDEALTIGEIKERLRAAGEELGERSNPAATISSICSRLVDQDQAIAVKKGPRNAWRNIKRA